MAIASMIRGRSALTICERVRCDRVCVLRKDRECIKPCVRYTTI